MEIWDAYTRDGVLTDKKLVRAQPIPEGLYHLVCEVLVRHKDGSYLCMRRVRSKSMYGGYYETTAGGSALVGESPLECIQRELYEETGIISHDFTEVAASATHDTLYHSFFCEVDIDKTSVVTQEGETDGYVWMSEEEFVRHINSDRAIPTQRARYAAFFISLGYM